MSVPDDWMPAARMSRIHVHWTAGGHKANATDKKSYHILIEGDGKLIRGDKSIKANEPNSGMTPASHTLNANKGAIGVSMCCMLGAIESPFNSGTAPMTKTQWDAMIGVVADLARRYNIPVSPTTILTHAEVQPNLGFRQRNKWDITRLAFDPSIQGHRAVGDKMRREVAAVLTGIPSDDDEVETLIFDVQSQDRTESGVWLLAGDGRAHHVPGPPDLEALRRAGIKDVGNVSREFLLRFERVHPALDNLP